jgi:hypothetical protein
VLSWRSTGVSALRHGVDGQFAPPNPLSLCVRCSLHPSRLGSAYSCSGINRSKRRQDAAQASRAAQCARCQRLQGAQQSDAGWLIVFTNAVRGAGARGYFVGGGRGRSCTEQPAARSAGGSQGRLKPDMLASALQRGQLRQRAGASAQGQVPCVGDKPLSPPCDHAPRQWTQHWPNRVCLQLYQCGLRASSRAEFVHARR